VAGEGEEGFEQRLLEAVLDHVDLERLIFDIWRHHVSDKCSLISPQSHYFLCDL